MLRKLREIVDELLHQCLRGAVIGGLVGPGVPGIEDRAVDARNRDRKFEAEIRVLAEFGVIEATVERRVEQRAGRLDRHTADAVHRRHRSEEHTSELQSLMRNSYAVLRLKKKTNTQK